MNERICDVRWEGPFPWDKCAENVTQGHVLYSLHGTHHLYGMHSLLYIGMTEADLGARLTGHEQWVRGEYDTMQVKVASVREFESVDAWWKTWDPDARYKRGDAKLAKDIEALLIYAHQPAYNTRGKSSLELQGGHLRVFNTGKPGRLFPELSSAYHTE